MIVRFDDTNPTKEKQEYQDAILQDLELLGIKGDRLTYTSDYFERLYQEAVKLIKLGKAYCDDTVQEQVDLPFPARHSGLSIPTMCTDACRENGRNR